MAFVVGQKTRAKFPGKCAVTGKPIQKGDTIEYTAKGWKLADVTLPPQASEEPKNYPELIRTPDMPWWRNDLTKIIGKELAADFDMSQISYSFYWLEKKRMITLTSVINTVNGFQLWFSNMFDEPRVFAVISKPIAGHDDYVVVFDDLEALMEMIVGDYDEYLKSKKVIAHDAAWSNRWGKLRKHWPNMPDEDIVEYMCNISESQDPV